MLNTRHVVIDIETMGLSPRALVRSVALHFFNPWGDDEPRSVTYYLSVQEQRLMGREVDPETMMWWMQQSGRARDRFCDPTKASGDVELTDVRGLADKLSELTDHEVWCKPLHFDVPILVSLLAEVGVTLDAPRQLFHRRTVQNARGVYAAASLRLLARGCATPVDEDPAHHGIADEDLHDPAVDARLTALTVTRALRILRA